MAIIIAAVNRKGGVGKTSVVFHLAGFFAQTGKRILLLDNDPQHSLSEALLGIDEASAIPAERSIAALFADDLLQPDVIHPTKVEGVHLVPGHDSLTESNLPRPLAKQCEDLRYFIHDQTLNYDLVIIDNPPNLQGATISALAAADFALCPLRCDRYGARGAASTLAEIRQAQRTRNSGLRLCGFLLNVVKPRLAIQKLYEERLRLAHGADVFGPMLPDLADFEEATAHGKPVSIFKPKCPAAKAIGKVAAEILERTAKLSGTISEAA